MSISLPRNLGLYIYISTSNFLHTTSYYLIKSNKKAIKRWVDMSRKQSLKLALSFKETVRDLEIYNFLTTEIKDEMGISTYIKMLIAEDMKKRKNQN